MKSILSPVFILGALGVATHLSAATIPYFENFDDQALGTAAPLDNQNNAWNESSGYSIVEAPSAFSGRSYNLNQTAPSGSLGLHSTFNVGSSLNGGDFILTTDFIINSATLPTSAATSRIGFGALSNNAGLSGGTWYLADFVVATFGVGSAATGTLRINEIGGNESGDRTSTASAIAINLGDVYRMSLEGTYSDGALVFDYTVENLSNPSSISMSTTYNTPLTGTHFGYRNSVGSGGSMDATLDNFSIIPEPGAYAVLFGMAGLSLAVLRRPRR